MSDDIERLLAEVSGTTSGSGAVEKQAASPAKRGSDKPCGRLAFAIVTAVAFGGIAFIIGWLFTPFVLSGTSLGLGAAVGSFVTALIAGPPRWFSS
ncbi:MAG: hypothetical protein ACKOFP_12735 [Actinomycetota bacterium]